MDRAARPAVWARRGGAGATRGAGARRREAGRDGRRSGHPAGRDLTIALARRRLLVLAVAFEGGALLLAFALGAVTGTPPFRLLVWSPSAIAVGVVAGLALVPLPVLAARSAWPPLVRLTRVVRTFVDEFFANATLLDLAVVSVLAGVGEEALFRGVVQVALADAFGTGTGLVLASALFGLAHPVTALYVAGATAVGALLGWLLVATGDLAAPIVAHAVYDFLALVWLVRESRART